MSLSMVFNSVIDIRVKTIKTPISVMFSIIVAVSEIT